MSGNIQRVNVTTRAGNTLQLFYNPDNDLVVLDLIAGNEQGGNEILRQTLNEKKLLKHAANVQEAHQIAEEMMGA